MTTLHRAREELLRRLAINDEGALESVLQAPLDDGPLDQRTDALVRFAGLVAVPSSPATYQWSVARALAAGASEDEIIGVLAALAPVVGLVRVTEAAAEVSVALGLNVDEQGTGQ